LGPRPIIGYVPFVRVLIVLIACAAIGFVTWLVLGTPFAKRPVTKAQIEHAVAQRPRARVQLVLCNEEIVPSRTPRPRGLHTWTCDTYLGRSAADAQNGPSYEVTVSDDHIASIRPVPTH
jgi:hypothetical protein